MCNFAGHNGDSGGVECYLWSGVIYGDMCRSGGNILRTLRPVGYYCRHYAGYDSPVSLSAAININDLYTRDRHGIFPAVLPREIPRVNYHSK